jgi:ferrous iron transport protein B
LENERDAKLNELALAKRSEWKERSFLGQIGHFVEPVLRPLGFDWRIGVSILSGIAAKEVIISSLSILYQVDEKAEEGTITLVERLRSHEMIDGEQSGQKALTPLVALSFMVFVLLYLPCIGTLTAISRESGSWKWGAFMAFYTLAIAWLMSFIVFQGGSLLGF